MEKYVRTVKVIQVKITGFMNFLSIVHAMEIIAWANTIRFTLMMEIIGVYWPNVEQKMTVVDASSLTG